MAYTFEQAAALAIQHYKDGNSDAAIDIVNTMVAAAPGDADAYNHAGNILQEMQRYEEALAHYDQALAIDPGRAVIHNNKGNLLYLMKRHEEAMLSYNTAIIILRPDIAATYVKQGNVLQHMGRYEEALVHYDKAIALAPNDAESYQCRGNLLVSKGNMQEAEAMFRKAISLKPDYVLPIYSLSHIIKYHDAKHPDIAYIQALLEQPDIPLNDQADLYFSLGKIYDDCCLYDQAFEYYRQANHIANGNVSFNINNLENYTNAIIKVFSEGFIAKHRDAMPSDESPLFIIGMPRSGTTLLTTMLSNHPSIATVGELSTIMDFTLYLPDWTLQQVPYPYGVTHLTPEIIDRMANSYISRLRRDIMPDKCYVIDKYPLNFWHLGLITILFPQAKIIHCTRNPLDTILSNYFQRFSVAYDYSFDLQNTADYYGEYHRLMRHWQDILPGNMIEISYEDAIMHTETTARKALDFLGLPWDEHCLSPHTNQAAIETASKWQARQPIYRGSMERWRHYEKYLGQLIEDLL